MSTTAKLFYQPTKTDIRGAEIEKFRLRVCRTRKLDIKDYWDLHRWSVQEPEVFWNEIWDHFTTIGDKGPGNVCPVLRSLGPAG
jgi:acetoacetyl-CoA synthetase